MSELMDITCAHFSPEVAGRVLEAMDTAESPGPVVGPIGTPVVAGFTIERELGRGAGGVTYLAHKHAGGAQVALKVMHPQAGAPDRHGRAWRELDLLQKVRLDCVPRLLDFGITGHSLYAATEYIKGRTLSQLYTGPAQTAAEMRKRVALLAEICRAAHALHQHGVIHRDLKPSNIIVDALGKPHIIDLGIALIDTPSLEQTLTQNGVVLGTPAFMAPEQARGDRESISSLTDVYALGAIGYWLCTGETPHDLRDSSIHGAIRRVGDDPVRPVRSVSAGVPKELALVLQRACARDQTARYSSAMEFADDLDRWLAGKSTLAAPPSGWVRMVRWIECHPFATTATSCLALVLATLTGLTIITWWMMKIPDRLVASADGRSLSLLSKGGMPLRVWDAWGDNGVVYGEFVRRQDGPSALLLGMQFRDREDGLVRLRVCAAEHPFEMIWETPVRSPGITLPAQCAHWHEGEDTGEYRFASATIGDLDQHPGTEIAVVLNHRHKSAACLRIYTLRGQLLAEAWHNGRINDVVWAEEAGVLVCAGPSDQPRLHDLGATRDTHGFPMMVYALDPQHLIETWDDTTKPTILDSWEEIPASAFAWTRVVTPVGLGETFRPKVTAEGSARVRLLVGAAPDERGRPPELYFGIDPRDGSYTLVESDPFKERYSHYLGLIELVDPKTITRSPNENAIAND